MKKKWIILCACMLLYGGAFSQSESQQVVALQYYFDNDPGIGVAGNGEIIDLGDAAESNESFSWTLPLSVTPGYHKLYVRVADEDGRWSVAERRNVLVFVSNVNADVTAMEYYVDSDPGAGNGIALPVTPGEWVNNNFAIDLASVSEGFHRLYIRYQNLSGAWSVSERRSFIVITPSSADDVAAMEYYLDADPGAGNGTTIPVTAGAQADGNFPVDLSAVPAGFHRIYVRHKDTG
ncbi:MAG: hypothetical protein JNM00_14425, partial [Flavobacteriales bacterium]|nr:hypothetical protein [Flavobacteriales bacterium]